MSRRERCSAEPTAWTRSGGCCRWWPRCRFVALEVGLAECVGVASAREAGFSSTEILRDLAGHERVVVARALSDAAAASSSASRGGGVALFPADTVYGLACDPEDAVRRRAAVPAQAPEPGEALGGHVLRSSTRPWRRCPSWARTTREAMTRLLPGGVTVLVVNPAGRFALACGDDLSTLGVRVVDVPRFAGDAPAGPSVERQQRRGPDPRRLADVPPLLRSAVDLVIDGGELPGTPSTVVDLRRYEEDGAVERGPGRRRPRARADRGARLASTTSTPTHTRTRSGRTAGLRLRYRMRLRRPATAGPGAILDLGTGTGETARRLLDRHPDASLVGIDENEEMLALALDRAAGFAGLVAGGADRGAVAGGPLRPGGQRPGRPSPA